MPARKGKENMKKRSKKVLAFGVAALMALSSLPASILTATAAIGANQTANGGTSYNFVLKDMATDSNTVEVSSDDVAAGNVTRRIGVYIDSEEELKRGSVIIVDDAERENHPLIKRIVGLGGDKLWIEDGYICVLEKGATESYRITEADGAPLNPIENETKEGDLADRTEDDPLVVPEGYVYYVGDNRNNSLDCRFTGPVSVSLVRGTVKGFVPGWYMIILRINGLESSGK